MLGLLFVEETSQSDNVGVDLLGLGAGLRHGECVGDEEGNYR